MAPIENVSLRGFAYVGKEDEGQGGPKLFYKRHEYFRYTFGEPLSAEFRIQKVDDSRQLSSKGDCTIIDVSLNGAKIYTTFDIPTAVNRVDLSVVFSIRTHPIEAKGTIVWKKPFRNGFLYGLHFEEDEVRERVIVDELKLLGKEEVEKRKNQS